MGDTVAVERGALAMLVRVVDSVNATLSNEAGQAAVAARAALAAPTEVVQVTDAMVTKYLNANDAYWSAVDALPEPERDPSKWRQGTPREATRVSLSAVLSTCALAAPAWQPIESAPKDGTTVLVYFNRHGIGVQSVSWTDRDGGHTSEHAHWHVDDNKYGPYPLRGYAKQDATHWMPLPAAPKEQL